MAGDKLAEQAWEELARAQIALMRRFQDDFRRSEVSMREYDVLFTLARSPEGLRMRDLGGHLLLTQPGISRLVTRMAAEGLVSRDCDSGDRRGTVVGLTERGRGVLRRAGRSHAAAIEDCVGAVLSRDELRSLRDIARKLRDAQDPG
ncbi:MarR family winged helix-turn-helix transcriptional regulator [Streptomonospora salina]|uniref:DNA-binding MarR family transcriptional regulator n=1 Tax=Streptomonospora salina TaxID=104205 RepID=A0A841E4Y7_9ACTN|nr:MarR family transcriptional regulator [Streptomonospora salina]MBB5996339.1 DNA-binding MarR family transcriptional regulator [Streptomonospora salina]